VLDADGVERTQQWTTTATLQGDTVVHLQAVGVDVTSSARARRLVDAERAWFAACSTTPRTWSWSSTRPVA
jgi:hypothetical protein